MKTLLLCGLLSATLLTMPAAAADRKPRSPDDVICRTEVGIDSRLSRKRVCLTRAEWEAQRQEAKTSIDKIQNTRMTNQQ